jgi:hypothetical protein
MFFVGEEEEEEEEEDLFRILSNGNKLKDILAVLRELFL